MKVYEVVITLESGLGTPLKGDTIFGHICWQIKYDESLFGKLNDLLSDYDSNPFIVVSSAFIKLENGYAFRRPELPLDMLFDFQNQTDAEIISRRKDLKRKSWMVYEVNKYKISLRKLDYLDSVELMKKIGHVGVQDSHNVLYEGEQIRNTINRLHGTTGEAPFVPYSVKKFYYHPSINLVIFVGLRDDIDKKIDSLREVFVRIGRTGFGKDSSVGFGRFEVKYINEIDIKKIGFENPNACYLLSPYVPKNDEYFKIYFKPFTRFGRHGNILALSGKPFKNPVIMADEASVIIPKDKAVFSKDFVGTSVTNLSKVEPNTVAQGYALYLPVIVEDIK